MPGTFLQITPATTRLTITSEAALTNGIQWATAKAAPASGGSQGGARGLTGGEQPLDPSDLGRIGALGQHRLPGGHGRGEAQCLDGGQARSAPGPGG